MKLLAGFLLLAVLASGCVSNTPADSGSAVASGLDDSTAAALDSDVVSFDATADEVNDLELEDLGDLEELDDLVIDDSLFN